MSSRWWSKLLHESVGPLIGIFMVLVVSLYAYNEFSKRKLFGIDGRKVAFLFAVLILGAGLIVNVIFKDNFGRARPRNVMEFGGTRQFTPAFVVAYECARNCSFSAGDGAGAFFSLALASAFSRKRAALWVAFGFGCLVSFSRVASGAHFFSDTVVSFFVMAILTDVLFFYLLLPARRLPLPVVPVARPALVKIANRKASASKRFFGSVDG